MFERMDTFAKKITTNVQPAVSCEKFDFEDMTSSSRILRSCKEGFHIDSIYVM